MRLPRRLRSLGAASLGGVALEFALMTPILVFTMCGLFDFARVMAEDARVAHAALAGAHFGMQSAAHAADPDGIERAARADIGNVEGFEVVALRRCTCPGGTTVPCAQSCEGEGKPLMHLTVAVAREFRTMMRYPMFSNPVPLYREAHIRVE
ncbi:MAG: TadE/TadG family type IV pilus assembly protein [Alphaproteobacteria bacterium]